MKRGKGDGVHLKVNETDVTSFRICGSHSSPTEGWRRRIIPFSDEGMVEFISCPLKKIIFKSGDPKLTKEILKNQ